STGCESNFVWNASELSEKSGLVGSLGDFLKLNGKDHVCSDRFSVRKGRFKNPKTHCSCRRSLQQPRAGYGFGFHHVTLFDDPHLELHHRVDVKARRPWRKG